MAGFIGSPPMNFVRGTLVAFSGSILMDADSLKLKLSDRARGEGQGATSAARWSSGSARTTSTTAPSNPRPLDDGNSCTLDVDVTEPMGATVYAYLNAGKHCFIADLKSETQAKIGGRLDVAFDMTKAHLFDPETEVALA